MVTISILLPFVAVYVYILCLIINIMFLIHNYQVIQLPCKIEAKFYANLTNLQGLEVREWKNFCLEIDTTELRKHFILIDEILKLKMIIDLRCPFK